LDSFEQDAIWIASYSEFRNTTAEGEGSEAITGRAEEPTEIDIECVRELTSNFCRRT
jgi:hypothetical protein